MVTRPVTRVPTMGAGPAPLGPPGCCLALGIPKMGLDKPLTATQPQGGTRVALFSPKQKFRFLGPV